MLTELPDVTKNVFYWSRVATIVAQGSGMHRSVEHSQLSKADKRLWKRIWWTLFTRDRMVAVALGRPVHINTDDSDVEMMSEDDFLEDDEPGLPAEYPPDRLHVQFFLHHVKLCEIMGLVLSQQYSVASKARRQHQIDLVHSDLALADWMLHVPPEMRYHIEDKSRQNFWAALLHSTYYTTLCLLHRAHMPPATTNTNGTSYYTAVDETYPSRNIAFKAATAITSIIDNLIGHDQLRYCPAFVVYSLFSALIMHVYQTRSTTPSVVAESKERMRKCMLALKEVSRTWIVAKMVYTLFESILGNKHLEERLQKSAGRRHHSKKSHHHQRGASNTTPTATTATTTATSTPITHTTVIPTGEPIKRKFDEMDLGALPALPVPTMSYERSRALTPGVSSGPMQGVVPSPAPMPAVSRAMTPGRDIGGSPFLNADARPTTPFNPGLAMVPGTPPDLYLVTRSSPPISQSLWENFQPNQLFPDDSGISYLSPSQQNPALDPQLTQQGQGLSQHGLNQHLQQQFVGGQWNSAFDEMTQGSSPEDTWSNSSKGGIVPTTLNVEDWYVFCFGRTGPPPLPPLSRVQDC